MRGEIVAGAWDFKRINRRYARHLKVLAERPGGALRNDATAKSLLRWAPTEREAWLEAVTNDPLLPGRILPSDYLGQQNWRPPANPKAGGSDPAFADSYGSASHLCRNRCTTQLLVAPKRGAGGRTFKPE